MLKVISQEMVDVNKRGFTLTEILAVIALIGVLLLFIMPNLTKIFSGSVKNAMKVQESELKEAGLLYLEDYCKNRLGNNICPGTISRENNKYSGYVTLSTLSGIEYIDEISVQGNDCSGCVIFTENNAKAYLTCGDMYETNTDVNFKSICNIN